MAKVVQMSQRMHESTRVRLCTPYYWRLERIEGQPPRGFLIVLRCTDEHVHHVEIAPTYAAAREAMRAWIAEALPEGHPPLPIADVTRGRLILPSGSEWPLAREGYLG